MKQPECSQKKAIIKTMNMKGNYKYFKIDKIYWNKKSTSYQMLIS